MPISLGIGPAITRGQTIQGEAEAWTPANLYTTEAGDWWLPTPGYVFEDAGVTPAADDGDSLYQINGQRGSINLVQSSAAARSTLRLSEINGNPAYQTDGAGDCWGDITLTLAFELTFWAAISYTHRGAYHNVYEGPSFNVPQLWINGANAYEVDGGATAMTAPSSVSGWHAVVVGSGTVVGTDDKFIDVDGSQVVSNATNNVPTGSTALTIHNRGGVGTLQALVACMGFISRRVTADERALLATYLGGLL